MMNFKIFCSGGQAVGSK